MSIEVDASEAEKSLLTMLSAVLAGNRFTITMHGEPIADLVPAEKSKNARARAAVEQMRRFMREAPTQSVNIRDSIDKGRA